MKNRFAAIGFSDICHFTDCVIYNFLFRIDSSIFIQVTINNNIRRNKIIVSKCCSQLSIFCSKCIQISKMFVLCKIACFQPVIISKLKNRPISGA